MKKKLSNFAVFAGVVLLLPSIALADNCSGLADCHGTIKAALLALLGIGLLIALTMPLSSVLSALGTILDIVGIVEAITGRNIITGEKLKDWERLLGAVPAMGMVGKATGEALEKLLQSLAAKALQKPAFKAITREALEHIFQGTSMGGFHHEGLQKAGTKVTWRSPKDANGVYTGKVEIDGIGKMGNSGYSSFFPKKWTPEQVVNAIEEAYSSRTIISKTEEGLKFQGRSSGGILIEGYLDAQGNIKSAYPVYGG